MNDIAKQIISEKLIKAIESEKIPTNDAALIIGVKPTYLSIIKNSSLWNKCPISAWDIVQKWINSGQTLKEYQTKHGRVIPEITPVKEVLKEHKKIMIEPTWTGTINNTKEKTELKKSSKEILIKMLIEEKELLQKKIEAIDLLLQHYE